MEAGRPRQLGREHQEGPARAARVPAHLPIENAMRRTLLALGLAVIAASAAGQTPAPNNAQQQQERQTTQPGNNAPVMREIRSGDSHYTSIQGRETGVLIQPPARFPGQSAMATAGEAWRNFRNGPVTFIGGRVVVLVPAAIVAFYLWKGPVKLHDAPTGRLMPRFSPLEQVVHWSTAI